MFRRTVTHGLLALTLVACSSADDGSEGEGDGGNTGGVAAVGGQVGAGDNPGSGGSSATGGAPGAGGETGGLSGTGGSGEDGACTNIRPTGTRWDEATCDMWAADTEECDAAWMIDNDYCNESCGRCTPGGGSGGSGGTGGTGGGSGTLPKFVGNITTHNQVNYNGLNFATYWNQITPENAGKWGSVQPNPASQFNWSTLDAIYDYAQENGIIFKQHTFVWGSQQPSGTPTQQQVINWIQSFCQRYPETALIDVVNEPPPHTTPSYANNIGGGTNGNWQWITNSFKWAREHCPDAILILNDYNNIEWPNDNQHFIDIVKTVLQNGGPIDAVGAQAHDLDHGSVTSTQVQNLLNKLHNDTGLPVYITEMDLSYVSNEQQLQAYQTYFPMFWNASFVQGITIWGWIDGTTWDLAPNSGLVKGTTSRSAMTWLMGQLGRPSP